MMSVRTANLRRSVLLCGCALGAVTWIAIGTASAQSPGAAKPGSAPAPVAVPSQNSELDMGGVGAAGAAPPQAASTAANQNSTLDMDAGVTQAGAASAHAATGSIPAPATTITASAPAANLPAATASVPDGPTAPTPLAGAAGAASATVSASIPDKGPSSHADVQDGIHYATVNPGLAAAPPSASQNVSPQPLPAAPAGTTVAPPATQVEPISLDHPTVVDTDTLKAGDVSVSLYGIEGIQGEAAQGMQAFLAANSARVTCQAEAATGFVCLLPDGTDVAEVALVNGAARVKDDAPQAYQDQQAAAEAARRGIWANLPPPPAAVSHPAVQDTATLVSDGQTYRLDGIVGLGAPYAQQLQGYIQANGDTVTCMPQGADGYYICTLKDGTDLAKVALVNGAARVAPDAPDAYRVQQGLALSNHRGFWLNPPSDVLLATSTVQTAPVCCAYQSGDDGTDGITYADGVPEAVIDGDTVFLAYAGVLGWGYYDHYHHWHGAPDRFRRHLEHFHPDGHGLRGYGHEEALHGEGALHAEAVHGAVPHPGMAGGFHPGPAGFRPGMASGYHPGMAGGYHPGIAGGFHPGMAGGFHPAGGFVHPGPSLGGFHPGGASGFHPATAHVASVGGGGRKR